MEVDINVGDVVNNTETLENKSSVSNTISHSSQNVESTFPKSEVKSGDSEIQENKHDMNIGEDINTFEKVDFNSNMKINTKDVDDGNNESESLHNLPPVSQS